jgi:hypothetical protein
VNSFQEKHVFCQLDDFVSDGNIFMTKSYFIAEDKENFTVEVFTYNILVYSTEPL